MQAGKQCTRPLRGRALTVYRLADQSVDVLKHITLRGGVWPNACAASIRDLSRHLNKPSKKLARSPESDAARNQHPSARFGNGQNQSSEPIDGLSTLAGAAEVHGNYDAHSNPRVVMYAQQAYNTNPQNDGNNTAYMPTPNSGFAAQAPDESFGTGYPPTTTPTTQPGGHGYNPDFPSAPFFGQGSQPAAPWPSDSLFDLNNVELFAGFDIPFWLDDEQYVPFLDNSGG